MHPALTQQMQAARLIELTASRCLAADHATRTPHHRFSVTLRRRRTAVAGPRPAV